MADKSRRLIFVDIKYYMLIGMDVPLFDRVEKRLLLCEISENRVQICFCDWQRWNLGVAEVKDIALVFLMEEAHFVDVHDVFSVASYQTGALETVFYRLEAAAHHVFREVSLTVCIPDFYVVVIRLDVKKVIRADR